MSERLRIVIAPNEDGFGTSAWTVRLVREVLRHPAALSVTVVVATEERRRFHEGAYRSIPRVRLVLLEGSPNGIQVAKKAGAVDVARTIEQGLLPYAASRQAYAEALQRQNVLGDADLVIDLGVPQMVCAVAEENVRRKGRGAQEIASVTLFDHAWGLTLARIAASERAGAARNREVEARLRELRRDEACTGEAILFGEPLCPPEFHDYWRQLLGRAPRVLEGSLGGPLATLDYAGDAAVEELRRGWEAAGRGPEEAWSRARRHSRKLLGIEDDAPVLFVSGGGTPVWDEVLEELLQSYDRTPPRYHVVIYNPVAAMRRGVVLEPVAVRLDGGERQVQRAAWGSSSRITFVEQVAGETHHVLFAAFDLVLTRAGGGTVSDALAFRVPLVLVEEPGMWQVEQIRRSCLRMGFAEGVALEALARGGRACVETSDGELKAPAGVRQRLREIPSHAEIRLWDSLLARVIGGG